MSAPHAETCCQARRAARPGSHACELTYAELRDAEPGTVLHFTNWPGTPSVPVTVGLTGAVRLPGGTELYAMPDELTWHPRAGLGQSWPAEVLTGAEQLALPAGCGCGYALSKTDGRWHLISRDRCGLHRGEPAPAADARRGRPAGYPLEGEVS